MTKIITSMLYMSVLTCALLSAFVASAASSTPAYKNKNYIALATLCALTARIDGVQELKRQRQALKEEKATLAQEISALKAQKDQLQETITQHEKLHMARTNSLQEFHQSLIAAQKDQTSDAAAREEITKAVTELVEQSRKTIEAKDQEIAQLKATIEKQATKQKLQDEILASLIKTVSDLRAQLDAKPIGRTARTQSILTSTHA